MARSSHTLSQFSNLNFLEFAILGTLLDGSIPGETLRKCLRQDLGWLGTDRQFFLAIGPMERQTFVTIQKELTSSKTTVRHESSYAITELGKAHWKHSFSVLRTLCDRWKKNAVSLPDVAVSMNRIKEDGKARRLIRIPDAKETAVILAKASSDFVPLFHLAIEAQECIFALSAIDITEVDFDARLIRLISNENTALDSKIKTIEIPDICCESMMQLVSGRSSGRLFTTAFGLPWMSENLRMYWKRLKEKLKIPKEVLLPSARYIPRFRKG
jgi:hypothetical protein